MARAGELGADQAVAFLREIDSINMRRRVRMVDIARDALGGSFIGKRITILGAAFKPDSDDVRDSPALAVARLIGTQGGVVTVTDPEAVDNASRAFPELNFVTDTTEALTGADAVLLLTEWSEYRDLDPAQVAGLVANTVLVDGRNVLDPRSGGRRGGRIGRWGAHEDRSRHRLDGAAREDEIARLDETTGGLFRIVPLTVIIGGESFTDGDLDVDVLCREMDAGTEVSTSMATPGQFAAAYSDLIDHGAEAIVVVTMSGELSGTRDSAVSARRPARAHRRRRLPHHLGGTGRGRRGGRGRDRPR